MAYTTKFTKGSKDAVKPFTKKFAEGGAVDKDPKGEDDSDKDDRSATQRFLSSVADKLQPDSKKRGRTLTGPTATIGIRG